MLKDIELKKERQKLRRMETGMQKIYHVGEFGVPFYDGDNIIRDAAMQEYLGGFGVLVQKMEEDFLGRRRFTYIYKRIYKPENGRYDIKTVLKEAA